MSDFEKLNTSTEKVEKKVWKDEDSPEAIDFKKRKSFITFEVDKNNYPLNPRGLDREEGKGVLYRWGPNLAADPMVTKIDENGGVEILLIKRKSGKWAFPGGMQDKDWEKSEAEDLKDTASRELKEETNIDLDFSQAEEIYAGYVDDPRNTKNAWIETTALNYRLSDEESEKVEIKAGDDAQDVKWFKIDDIVEDDLHASHFEILEKLKNKL